MSPSISAYLALLIGLLTLGLAYITAIIRPANAFPLLAVLAVLTFLTWLLHFSVEAQQFDILLRYLIALAGLFAFHLSPLADLRRVLAYVAMVVIGYATFIAATRGVHIYAGTPRLWPLWAGVASSSLTIAPLTLLLALSPINRAARAFWVCLGLVLVVGYGVVTTFIMVAMFFGGWYFLRKGWNRGWLYIFGVIAVVAGILFRDSNTTEGSDIAALGLGAIGSGRIDAWLGRFHDFGERDFSGKLIGFGPYSDYQISAIWDWEPKSAHSDLVTMLMEFGILGLGALLLLALRLYKRANRVEQVMLIAMAFGAAASNALLDRPVVAVAWGIALYACRYHVVERTPPRRCRAKELAIHEQKVMRAIQKSR